MQGSMPVSCKGNKVKPLPSPNGGKTGIGSGNALIKKAGIMLSGGRKIR